MAGRKSYIEIGWKLDESGLKKANQLTDQAIQKSKERAKAMQDSVSTEQQVSKQVKQTNTEMSRTGHLAGLIGKNLKTNFGTFENASKSLKTAGNHLESAGRSTRTASLAVGAGLAYSAKQAMDLQQSYKETTNLLVNGGEKQKEAQKNVNKMTQDGAKYSQKYGKSQKELASGYEELVKRGYTSNQALGAQKSLLQASIASGDSYSDVVHNSTAALESFGMRAKSTSGMIKNTKEVTNEMAYAADATATDFSGMGTAMTYVGATAHQSGMSLHETASAIGILSNNGIEADKAGTGLRKALVSLQSPTKRGTKALGEMGLSTDDFVAKSGKMKSMTDIFGMLNSHTKNMSNVKQGQLFYNLFGATGQQSATILANNAKQLGELDKKVQDSSSDNYVQKIANKNMGTAKMQLARFKQASTAVGVDLAKEALPALTKLATKATVLLEKFDKLPNSTKKFATYGALAVTALSPLLSITGGVIKNIGYITGGIGKLKNIGKVEESLPSTSTTSVPTTSARPNTSFYKGTKHLPTTSGTVPVTSSPAIEKAAGTKINWSSVATKTAWAGVGLDIGANIVGAVHSGLGSKQGGKDLWQGAGTGIGAAIGSIFGPAGTVIGGTIGNKIATAFANSKLVKNVRAYDEGNRSPKGAKKGKDKYDAASGGSSFDTGDGTVTRSIWDNPISTKPKKKPKFHAESLSSVAYQGATSGISKSDRNYFDSATKQMQQASVDWASSAGKATDKVKGDFNSLYELAESKGKSELSTQKTNLEYLKKQGLLTNSQVNSQYDDAKNGVAKRLKSLKTQINSLTSQDTKGGKQREKAISKLNVEMLKLTDSGSKKQQALLKQMNKKTTKLNGAQYDKVISSSNKAYKSTVSNANKTYKKTVSSANKRYEKEKSAANSITGISETQRKKLIAKAESQRDRTIANAKTQHDDTISYAEKQKTAVVKAAKDQFSQVVDSFGAAATSIGQLLTLNNMAGIKAPTTKQKKNGLTKHLAGTNKALTGGNVTSKTTGGSLSNPHSLLGKASGGAINRNQNALVGEEGHELAYNPRTGKVRLLGSNGPAIQKLYAGEHILNASDTRKVMNGGIGVGKTLKGYATGTTTLRALAGGTTKLSSTSAKTSTFKVKASNGDLSKTEKKTKKSMKSISKSVTGGYSKSTKASQKSLNSFNKKSNSIWKDTQRDTDKATNKIRTGSEKDYKALSNNLHKTSQNMNKTLNKDWNGTVSDFNTIFGKLDNYSHSAMKSAIGQLNGGIKGIDTTLGKFGGNGSVLPLIHYASGTQGPISKHTMAVVNDAKSGPKQEAIVRNGHALMASGNDVVTPLQPGDEVLNGHETQAMQDVGILPHFAKGTGALKRLASKNQTDSSGAFNNDFSNNVKGNLGSTLANGIKGSAKAGAGSTGKPWYGAMWTVIDDAISGGGAGGPVTHAPGAGWGVSSGFGNRGGVGGGYSSHDGVDYSGGKTVHAMNTGTVYGAGGPPSDWGGSKGIGQWVGVGGGGLNYIYQELNGKNSSGAKLLVSKGDHVKAGQPIAVLGSAGTHVHVGATHHKMFSIGGSSTAGWLDPRDVTSKAIKTDTKTSKKDSALQKLAKKQLGQKALSWISKNLGESDELGSLGGVSLGGGVASRAQSLTAAIKQLYPSATNSGIAAVLGNWSFESGLNPSARNSSGGASGLGQWIGGRFSNLQRFANKHGTSWKSPATQLKFALTQEGSDSSLLKSVLRGTGSVASLASRFSSGWERGGYTAQHVAGARKVASALKYAKGGNPPVGQDVLVGEKGPELARFTQPATIYSNPQTKQMLGKPANGTKSLTGGTRNTFNIKITVKADSGTDGKSVGKQIAEAFKDKVNNMINIASDELS